jgi:hypothetical protein
MSENAACACIPGVPNVEFETYVEVGGDAMLPSVVKIGRDLSTVLICSSSLDAALAKRFMNPLLLMLLLLLLLLFPKVTAEGGSEAVFSISSPSFCSFGDCLIEEEDDAKTVLFLASFVAELDFLRTPPASLFLDARPIKFEVDFEWLARCACACA